MNWWQWTVVLVVGFPVLMIGLAIFLPVSIWFLDNTAGRILNWLGL